MDGLFAFQEGFSPPNGEKVEIIFGEPQTVEEKIAFERMCRVHGYTMPPARHGRYHVGGYRRHCGGRSRSHRRRGPIGGPYRYGIGMREPDADEIAEIQDVLGLLR